MISVDLALERILAGLSPLGSEIVPLTAAHCRVLADDIAARRTQPPFAVSSMDGYAVRAADVASAPVTLTVVGYAQAGGRWTGDLGAGQAVRIFTGAPMPNGADAVVLQEDSVQTSDKMTVREASPKGKWVRAAGLDFEQDRIGLRRGKRLTARDIALAAAMNIPWLSVYRRPRVAILPTGDEVVFPGEPVGPNQIVSANGFGLAVLIETAGGSATQLGLARDTAQSLKHFAAMAEGFDMLVTIGGASVGEHDLVKSVLGEEGLALDFWKIAMRPGKPLMFGGLGRTPLIGLPGNPVSAFVCALLFLIPALERLQGMPAPGAKTRFVATAGDLAANDERQDYLRASLLTSSAGEPTVQAFAKQDSSMLSVLAEADCLLIRPPHAPSVQAGDIVPIIPFGIGL